MKLFAESIASASKVTVAVAPMERGSPYDRGFLEGLAEGRSSPGCDGRCEARTQGGFNWSSQRLVMEVVRDGCGRASEGGLCDAWSGLVAGSADGGAA